MAHSEHRSDDALPVESTPTTSAVALAVSTVIFALRSDGEGGGASLRLPLVRRIREPFEGEWALPGGPISAHEGLAAAAGRNLLSTTGLTPTYLEQLYAFGDTDRSPGERVVSIVYWALVRPDQADRATVGDNVRWFAADELPRLAFDHNEIVDYALWRLRTKMEYSRIAHAFLGETFTLAELRQVHEAVLQRELDPANFRRQMESSHAVVPTGERLTGGRHRPPRLYRYNDSAPLIDNGPLTSA
ncbi:NrtR DNA-binding winged helix domain-containing protein [Galbitalea soli]|uniref:NUDIX domain-containing protein n=1 Tax=Galbitalea soli TaxID=1268042 RepID=A0A7C9TPC9_9MICO|nr:NUDIX domain-containing protein [Galbitalea soli]NYJ30568.1 8-oxo-dGTP diphosphatase [Galbitalea soli]